MACLTIGKFSYTDLHVLMILSFNAENKAFFQFLLRLEV